MMQSRLSQYLIRGATSSRKFELPNRYQGGRVEKYFNYWKGVGHDYKEAIADIKKGARDRPLKAIFLASTAGLLLYLNKKNPDELSFKDKYLQNDLEVIMVPTSIKNPKCDDKQNQVSECYNLGLIRRWNLGILSVMWRDDYDKDCSIAASQCTYLKPGYFDFSGRIIDIGFMGRWWRLEKAMEEFDINPNEWDESGKPKLPNDQWNPEIAKPNL